MGGKKLQNHGRSSSYEGGSVGCKESRNLPFFVCVVGMGGWGGFEGVGNTSGGGGDTGDVVVVFEKATYPRFGKGGAVCV
jgi:hypothetical protein